MLPFARRNLRLVASGSISVPHSLDSLLLTLRVADSTARQAIGQVPIHSTSDLQKHDAEGLSTQESGRQDSASAGEATGQRLIQTWQKAILERQRLLKQGARPEDRPHEIQTASQIDVRKLLHTAAQLRHAKAAKATEQLLQVIMDLFKTMAGCSKEKHNFLSVLVSDFGVQTAELDKAIAAYQTAVGRRDLGEDGKLRALDRIRRAAQPLYRSLFVPISNQPGGIKFLVDMRADILAAVRESPSNSARLRALSESIRDMAQEWFSVGLMDLERITWEGSPAALLQKVMEYESVHPYKEARKWEDLRQRLGPLRRVYGFFHPSMPGEPLVLLHTALMPKIASSLESILREPQEVGGVHEGDSGQSGEVCTRPEDASAAVFYSISASQKGLSGIDLGNFLIKKVARKLLAEFPNIRQLSTLSPIPGFSAWFTLHLERSGLLDDERFPMQSGGARLQAERSLLTNEEVAVVRTIWREVLQDAGQVHAGSRPREGLLRRFGAKITGQAGEHSEVTKAMLLRLVAHYLLREKRRGMCLDPVANFHLRNGAEVMRLNWQAGGRSMEASYGIMVNYSYNLNRISANNRAYLQDGTVVASEEVQRLLSDLVP